MSEISSLRSMAVVSVGESKIHGQGVFARREFLQDELVLEIDDSNPVLDREELTPDQEIFIDVFVTVDGTEKVTWMEAPEKFINHSCDPNTVVRTDMMTGVRRVFALKDIRKDDELTWDYAINIWEEWVAPVPCNCGAENCRRIIRGNFFSLPPKVQRRSLPLLDEPFKRRFAEAIRSHSLTKEAIPR